MTQVTMLDARVDISGTGVLNLPATSAGTNRKRIVEIAAGLTASNVSVPTQVSCDGQIATYEAGATSSGRTAITAFSFTDAQIALFTARALTITGGDTNRRIVSSYSIKDTDQAISNTNGVYTSGTGSSTGSPVSCVRSPNSLTVASVKVMQISSSTMANPARVGFFSTASSRLSFGNQTDTANTSDTTFSHGSALTYELVINFKEASGNVVDISGDSSTPDIFTGTNTVNTEGLGTVTSCVLSTATKGSVTIALSLPTGDGNFVVPWPPADGATYPYFGTVTATFSSASGSAPMVGTFVIPTGFVATPITDAVNNSSGYLGAYVTLLDLTRVYVETGDAGSGILTIGPTGLITASKALVRNIYIHQPDDYTVDTYTVTINGAGEVVSVTRFIGSTIKGSLLAGSILKGKLL